VHISPPGAGADDVLSAGAQAVAVTRPTTANTDTRQKTLRMGGIIAHLAMRRQHSDHDDCAPMVRQCSCRAPACRHQPWPVGPNGHLDVPEEMAMIRPPLRSLGTAAWVTKNGPWAFLCQHLRPTKAMSETSLGR